MAKIKTARKTSAGGCLIEVAGLISLALMFVFPPMIVVGLILLIVGARMTYRKICSDCGNPVESTSKMCPACRQPFGKHAPPMAAQAAQPAPIKTTPGKTTCYLCENVLHYDPKHSGRKVKCKYCDEEIILN